MERRKKGSGRITYVEDRKSPWRATVTDGRGKQKTRFFLAAFKSTAIIVDMSEPDLQIRGLLLVQKHHLLRIVKRQDIMISLSAMQMARQVAGH